MLAFWSPEGELRAKELLYRCLEELRVTKAALYLVGSEGSFELATNFGFGRRDAISADVKPGHPLWDWVRRHRSGPAYANEAADIPELRPLLEDAGTSRLLTIPLTAAGRLVGFVDARDKGRKASFGPEDVPLARTIGAALEEWLGEIGAYGEQTPPEPAAPTPISGAAAKERNGPHPHSDAIEEVTALVRCLAGMRGVAATALMVTDGVSVRVLALCAVPLDNRQREAIASHQRGVMAAGGVRLPAPNQWGWVEETSRGGELVGDEVRTGILLAGPPAWAVLSVVTKGNQAVAEQILAAAQRHLALAGRLSNYRRAARNLARTLLEPGEESYRHLRQHAQTTSELVQRIAAVLQLGDDEEEFLTIAGYLHDVGMRELDYGRIYRMDRPGEAERRIFKRHPLVGAHIVESAAFPGDLAAAIRHHHERWDGNGYPQRLAGRNIPLASRVIHIAEVYDTLTSASSYKRAIGREAALDVIRAEAGQQFDPDLIPALEQALGA
jgi:putative nucleotidyltransferase with HDIG domain